MYGKKFRFLSQQKFNAFKKSKIIKAFKIKKEYSRLPLNSSVKRPVEERQDNGAELKVNLYRHRSKKKYCYL
jgi:hypothetical protein